MQEPWQVYYKKYRKSAFIGIMFLIIESLIDLSLPNLLSKVVDQGIKCNRLDLIINYGLMMIALTLVGAIFAVGRNIKATEVSYGVEVDLSQDIFNKILRLQQADIDSFDEGSLITRAANDVLQIKIFLQTFLRIFFKAPVMAVGSVLMASLLYPPMALIFIAMIIPISLLVYLNVRIAVPLFYQLQHKLEKLNHKIQSTLLGIKVVRSFNRYLYEEEHFEKYNQAYSHAYKNTKKRIAIFFPLINFVLYSAMLALLLLSSYWIRKSDFEVGYIVAMVAYFQQFFLAIMVTMRVFDRSLKAKSSKVRLDAVFALEDVDQSGNSVTEFEHLECKALNFGYGGKLVLKNINFELKKGQFTAIIGATGVGKTSIVKLLTKEYSALNGNIYYNNQPLSALNARELRKRIAVVRQNDIIFSGSVSENLRFAKQDASENELNRVLKIAEADKFVANLAKQKQTLLGRNGVKLSGGQRQRIALARALLKAGDILVLDDSTSSLDNLTEQKILSNLKNYCSDLTLIMIAQKISSIKTADQIIVLDDGKVDSIGNHQQLLETSAVYRAIYHSQTGANDDTE